MRIVPSIAGLFLTALLVGCGGGTTPLIDYCCVDTLVQVDRGQDITGLRLRGTVSLVWNITTNGDSTEETFVIDSRFLDFNTLQDSVSGGVVTVDPFAESGDVYTDIHIGGNPDENIPAFTTAMYIPPPLKIDVDDSDPQTSGSDVRKGAPLTLRWTPSTLPDSKVRLIVRSRNADTTGLRRVELLFTVDDTGEYTLSENAMKEFAAEHSLFDVIAFRSYKKCVCLNFEPYIIRTSTYSTGVYNRINPL